MRTFQLLLTCLTVFNVVASALAKTPNVLIITVDDMSADSMGLYGCSIDGLTPNMDAVVRRGLRFQHAHVQVGNCMPGRNTMWSGLFPHNHGVEGFVQVKEPKHKHLVDFFKDAGYFTAIRGKASHSTPYHPYHWDAILTENADGKQAGVKDAASYGYSTMQGIKAAHAAGKPFCLMVNVSDPHKPFYAQGRGGETIADPNVPTRVVNPSEVSIPGFLFDDPVVRKELAHYYSSVSRADDAVGATMEMLEKSGHAADTIVMFLSDHGMALPFAKTQLYHHSTHTPLAVSVPGMTEPNSIDMDHMVSAVDLLPTLLDVCQIDTDADFDGRSFAPILKGETQDNRDYVIKEYNENSGRSRDPMRAIQTKDRLYIYNAWSNGLRIFATATSGTPTYKRLKQLAETDTHLRQRHRLYQFRDVEELFDVTSDPDCLVNLMSSEQHQSEINYLRQILLAELRRTNDPFAAVLADHENAAFREQFVAAQEAIADQQRRKTRKNKRNAQGKNKASEKANAK